MALFGYYKDFVLNPNHGAFLSILNFLFSRII